ncbi:MAG: hypothetical protein KY455_03415 [Euryarchaeota archaeon]|nr:hypothetical protein [Euryarchaeota archaeon]
MAKTVQHKHPIRAQKALNIAISMVAAGLALLIMGVAYLWFGPTGADVVYGWFVATTVVGVTILLLSPVIYFSAMEALEPDAYLHEKQ